MRSSFGPTLDAELEVQHTTKRAESTTFLCLLRKAIGPALVHVDCEGIVAGRWRGEVKCAGPKATGAIRRQTNELA